MKKMVLLSIMLLSVGMIVLAGCKSAKMSRNGDEMTFKGTFSETKDGVYVGDVVVTDKALKEFGIKRDTYSGKTVEITGIVSTFSEGETGSSLDKNGNIIYAQMREGSTVYMTKIKSIKLMKTYAIDNEIS